MATKPGAVRDLDTRKKARMALFARLWTGKIAETVRLCRDEGVAIGGDTAASYLRDPRFIDILRAERAANPGSGIWAREELQRWLCRAVEGIEPDGEAEIKTLEPIVPGEADYDNARGGLQFRKATATVPTYIKGAERLRAAELLGRSLGLFLERVDVSGTIGVADLLDDDLRHAKQVVDIKSEALPLSAAPDDDTLRTILL